MSLMKEFRFKSKKIRESAQGEDCQARIPGVCDFNSKTTIWGHLGGGGIGTKQSDELGAYLCHDCHAVIDFRVKSEFSSNVIAIYFWDAHARSMTRLRQSGLLTFAR